MKTTITVTLLSIIILVIGFVWVIPRPVDFPSEWAKAEANIMIMWLVIGVLIIMCINPLREFRRFHIASKILYVFGVGCAIWMIKALLFELMPFQLELWITTDTNAWLYQWRIGLIIVMIVGCAFAIVNQFCKSKR